MKNNKRNFKWSFLIQLCNQLIGFIVTVVLARLLLPEDFGIVGILTIFINVSRIFTDGGMAVSLIRSEMVDQKDYTVVFWFNLMSSVFFYVLLFFSANFWSKFFDVKSLEELIKVYGITVIISAFTITQSVQLNRNLNFKAQFFVIFPSQVISSTIGIVLALYGFGIWSLVIRELSMAFISACLLWYQSPWYPEFNFDKKKFFHHFNFGYKLTLTELLTRVFSDIYKAIIAKFFSLAQLGFFTRAKSLQELPTQMVFNTVNRVMFPTLAKVSSDNDKLVQTYGKIIKRVNFFITPVLFFMYLNAELMIEILFTSKWLGTVPFFKILIIAAIIGPIQPYLMNILKVKGRSDLVLTASFVEYAFVGIGILAVFPFGINGLLYGIVFANLAKVFYSMHQVKKLIAYELKTQIYHLKDGFLVSAAGVFILVLFDFIASSIDSQFLLLSIKGMLYFSAIFFASVFFKIIVVRRKSAFINFTDK